MSKSGRIERYRGDSYPETFTVTDAAGTPVNLEGAVVRFTVKDSPHHTEAVLAKSSTQPGQIQLLTPGTFAVCFSPTEMSNLEVRRYLYDVEVTLGDGTIHTVACDYLDILADVTG
ncbi:MAG TPA: hypothetical protein PLQ54_03075 [Armatimonadota bacterium]|nr:hypothetical protein [Armatimonadota bacterium]